MRHLSPQSAFVGSFNLARFFRKQLMPLSLQLAEGALGVSKSLCLTVWCPTRLVHAQVISHQDCCSILLWYLPSCSCISLHHSFGRSETSSSTPWASCLLLFDEAETLPSATHTKSELKKLSVVPGSLFFDNNVLFYASHLHLLHIIFSESQSLS